MPSPPLAAGDIGGDVARLHENLKLHGLKVSPEEQRRKFFGPSTREAVTAFQKTRGVKATGEVGPTTVAAIDTAVPTTKAPDLSARVNIVPGPASTGVVPTAVPTNPSVGTGSGQNLIEGRIFFDHGLPAEGVTLRLYRKGFGGTEAKIGEGKTDDQGGYAVPLDASSNGHLEVRAVDAQGNETTLSAPFSGAETTEPMNLVAPASIQPQVAEYRQLATDLKGQVGDLSELAKAQENDQLSDLTLLHEATGWDARLIAVAATASKLRTQITAESKIDIPEDGLYALLRMGLPAEKQQLAGVGPATVERALKTANAAGIAELNDQRVAQVKSAFESFSRETRLAASAPGATSTYRELLNRSGLSSEKQDRFANLYLAHEGTAEQLWQKAQSSGFEKQEVDGLRLQGKLAYLTNNNADLIQSLQADLGTENDLPKLVDMDLDTPEGWKTRLQQLAGNDPSRLAQLIPTAFSTSDAYAEDMARKVESSYPNHVVARMVQKDNLLDDAEASDAVHSLLTRAAALEVGASGKRFTIGSIPIDALIRQHKAKLFPPEIPRPTVTKTTTAARIVQRVYQFTPSNSAMKVLFQQGLTSAHDVTAISKDDFLGRFGRYFPSMQDAEEVYKKASQVSGVVQNVVHQAKQLGRGVQPFVIGGTEDQRNAATKKLQEELLKHYPTMESLFGSLDFCECEHCRSVLSPAAYLVDLLKFIEPDDNVWKGFLNDWQSKHNRVSYADSGFMKAFDALVLRRPDLQYLPLTCENTNTAMPYIDLVNEILEYYVAHDKLDDKAAHDTGEATTDELLAEPQNVVAAAYDKLAAARYPLRLPFDLWLETVRSFFEQFEMPFWKVLEVLRTTDKLFPPNPPDNPQPAYYRFEIFAEQLGLSSSEYAIFTDPSPLPKWHELYGYQSPDDALTVSVNPKSGQRIDLNSAKVLSRKLGVTYKQIVEIIQTGFVNPWLETLAFLPRLGVSADDVFRYKEQPGHAPLSDDEKTAFETRLQERAEELKLTVADLKSRIDTAWSSGHVNEILLLRDPDTGCNFDKTTLQYADGRPADALAFLKINLFVRLWRKLGWSMAETDRALQTFVPSNLKPLTAANLGAAFKTALLYLAHLKALYEQVKVGKNSRQKLLTLWSELSTIGKNPLYAQLFLNRGVLKNDPVFDDPLGHYLSVPGIFLKDHLLAVQGALNLTSDEIALILADAKGKALEEVAPILDAEPLTLATVSLFYRHSLLAKGLKMSIREIISLKALSGLDPVKTLSADPATTIDDDYPFSQTIRFVEIAGKIKESGFKVPDLDYLFRHRADPVGTYRTDTDALLSFVKTLAAEIRRIQKEHAVPADAASFADDTLRQKLALALPTEVAEDFFSMWAGTKEYEAVHTNPVLPANKLLPETFLSEPSIRVSYNETLQEQRLIFRGVLLDTRKAQLKTSFPGPTISALLDSVQQQANDFFKQYIQKSTTEEPLVGFLQAADFDTIFAAPLPIPDDKSEAEKQTLREQNEDLMRQKRKRLAEAFLPFLQQKLIRQFLVQNLATNLNSDPALTEGLLTDIRLLTDPSALGQRLLDAFAAAADSGYTQEWFASVDGTGTQLGTAAGANSARISGFVEVPTTGAYRFFITSGKKDAEVELRFGYLPDPLVRGKADKDGTEISEFVQLKAGVPYRFTLDARNLNGGDVSLSVLGENLPKGTLDRLTLYSNTAVERVRRGQVLLAKTLRLIQGLNLTEREVRYLLSHASDFDNVTFSNLPTRDADDSTATAKALFAQFLRLGDYARLKNDLTPESSDLIGIFEGARRTFPVTADAAAAKDSGLSDLCQRFADLIRRSLDTVQVAVQQFGLTATSSAAGNELRVEVLDFAQEKGLWRLWEALQVMERLGVSARAIWRWATPRPDFAVAHDVRDTIKAKYEPEDWQRIAQPIFDKLRQKQRDGLVAYVLQNHHERFQSANQLFEYFLVDPGMEPVVQTSRIRLAISCLQLFIQRCLLNLEKFVHPSAINSKHWQWMKRYRIWEANRKIFLFPENWLEPEFRDDKTHLFQELEGALLQGDVSSDLVEDAFFNYLKKLEELARLEIVSMYCEENAVNPEANTLHVIGRTYVAPRKYFYRRYAQQMWTPWEPIGAEIESDHIAAVMWRDRLHLFWVTFMEKPKRAPAPAGGFADSVGAIAGAVTAAVAPKDIDVQLSWSEYFQGQWSDRRSSNFITALYDLNTDFVPPTVSIHVSRDFEDGEETAVRIHLGGTIRRAFKLVSRHSDPVLENWSAPPDSPYGQDGVKATQFVRDGEPLQVTFQEHFEGILPTFGPEVCSWAPGRLDLFVRGSDDALWHNPYFGSWSGWERLGGSLTSDPAAVSWEKGRIDVFGRGIAQHGSRLLHRSYVKGKGWSFWEYLRGGELTASGPAVCSWAAGRLDVFVRGTDNALWRIWYDGDWSRWELLGGILSSDPAAISWSFGRIDVFARGTDNALWHKWYDGGWSGWTSLGGVLKSGPTVCSWMPGRLDVFVQGTDNALWHIWYDETGDRTSLLGQSNWSRWESLGGNLAAKPTAVSWAQRRTDVVIRGPDDILMHRYYNGDWSDWEALDSMLGFRVPAGQVPATKEILQENRDYSLLLSSNPAEFVFPEVGALMRPFFYQNELHTFFIEPRVTDTTIERWEEWVITTPIFRAKTDDFVVLKEIPIVAQIPRYKQKILVPSFSPYSRFGFQEKGDWLVNPKVALEFNQQRIGLSGAVGSRVASSEVDLKTSALANRAGTAVSTLTSGSASPEIARSEGVITVTSRRGVNRDVLNNLRSQPAAFEFGTGRTFNP
jgi:hypothetical protein